MRYYSSTGEGAQKNLKAGSQPGGWISGLSWFFAVLMIVLLVWVLVQRTGIVFSSASDLSNGSQNNLLALSSEGMVSLPEYSPLAENQSITRIASVHTIIPTRERLEISTYEVQPGDSVFGIAVDFGLKPESILWANYDLLQDNPNNLSVGQILKIPAVDGVVYKWKKSDTIESVARRFKAEPEDILTWPANNLDLFEPVVQTGADIMIPGGSRELRSWVVPTIWRANSGANKEVAAGCDTSGGTAYGTGTFIWPADNHKISGNDFWSGHLGLDIAAATGAPVYASDSGVVVYAAGIGGGYGLMVMIDHGNGFHTLYAHNSQIVAKCGQNVAQGQVIAYAGSTGNSTGPHLHFEIRYSGMFVNPWDYLR